MTERTVIGLSAKDRFLQVAREELLKFERDEREFRKKYREERAQGLHLPLRSADLH